VVTAVFALAPLVAYFGPLGFAALVPLGGLLLTPTWVRSQPARPVVLIFVALWIWLAASVAWSPVAPRPITADYDTAEALTELKLLLALPLFAALPAAAAGMSGRAARRALLVLGVVLTAYGLALLLDALAGGRVYAAFAAAFDEPVRPHIVLANLGRGAVLLAALAAPVALALDERWRPLRPPLILAALAAPVLLSQASATAALLAGGVAFWLVRRWGVGAVRGLGAAAVAVLLAAPWAVVGLDRAGALDPLRDAAPASSAARVDIWRFTAERVAERPLRGWGLDASREFGPIIPLHPHSAPLQLWLELGLHGAVLAALIWWWLFELIVRAARRDRTAAGALAAAAVAWFAIASLSFGVWQEWWLAVGALTAAVCAVLVRARAWERLAHGPDGPALSRGELRPL